MRPARTAFGGGTAGERGYVTITLIVLNALALLLAGAVGGAQAIFSGGLFTGSTDLLTRFSIVGAAPIFDPVIGVAAGEYYRLFTAMFLHYGIFHLLMNMWALWVLGRVLEGVLGPLRFLALYLVAGLGGSVAVYLFSAPNVATAGASGAVFGLFAALFVVLRRMRRDTSSVVPVLVINLVITFAVPGISIAGHLGGLVAGAIAGAGLAYAPRKIRTPVQVATIVGTLLVLAVVTMARTATLVG